MSSTLNTPVLTGDLLFGLTQGQPRLYRNDGGDRFVDVTAAAGLIHDQYGMGIAWGCKLHGDGDVCVTYCGDGGTSEGDFHEALNFAAVWQAPVVFISQNNQWAISVPREKQTRSETIAQKGIAYGMPCLQVDGNDPLAVHVAVTEALDYPGGFYIHKYGLVIRA